MLIFKKLFNLFLMKKLKTIFEQNLVDCLRPLIKLLFIGNIKSPVNIF